MGGAALSDFLVTRFAPSPTVLITAVLFVGVILIVQLRGGPIPALVVLGGTVSMVGVFGTMVADVTHVALGVPYAVSTPVFLASTRRRVHPVAARRGNRRRAHDHQHLRLNWLDRAAGVDDVR